MKGRYYNNKNSTLHNFLCISLDLHVFKLVKHAKFIYISKHLYHPIIQSILSNPMA